ncbi:MAG: hypothetical protein JJE25_11720 [Bacteroidia bacterium]|nr:hypothetical protein [Bacteroidia bacterium]
MEKLLIVCCIFFISFYSCKKDETIVIIPPTPVIPQANTVDEFTMFHPGNYWIYQWFRIDSLGTIAQSEEDSCYYKGDTIINGNTYQIVKYWWVFPWDQYLRDSSGYLLQGWPVLSTAVTNDTFNVWQSNDTSIGNITSFYYTVTSLANSITVPAGTFNNILDVTNSQYRNPISNTIINPVIAHTYYAKNIGKISEQFYYSGELFSHPHVVHERRLIRYHVN